jgi:hypothetical protein
MANFKLVSANEKEVWSTQYALEYTRQSGWLPYMSKADNAIISVNTELSGKAGSQIHFPYFAALSGSGVTGSTTLMGAEENLQNFSTVVRTSLIRNGVSIPESETYKTELDIANVARGGLKSWSANKLSNDLITAAQSMIIPGPNDTDGNPTEDTYVSYAAASAGQRNTHLTNNLDRTLFGNVRANSVSSVMATALATVTAAQKLSAGTINMAKAMAQATSPFKINPYSSDATAGREWFVLFTGPEGFRDASNDATILAANKDARPRDVDSNPIFQGGDLIYNGVIIRLLPNMPLVGNVGNGSASIGHSFLCGSQALCLAYSLAAEPRTQAWDYNMLNNLAIVEIRGQVKRSVKGVQTGMVSLFHAAAPDA